MTDVCRGFKDTRTVELLLQRAYKLEHCSVQKKKFSELGQSLLALLDTIRYDTIDDLHWKTDRQAASLI